MTNHKTQYLLESALSTRGTLLNAPYESALRLFNGFTEGEPNLVVDLYAQTIVIHNYADKPAQGVAAVRAAQDFFCARFPWIKTIVVKTRNSQNPTAKRGEIVYGSTPDRKIRENGVWYAFDPLLNRDASFYLDTRNVRIWAKNKLAGKSVLNTFAYTGSLGVAARAGGASHVVQLDLNRNFLNVAKTSYTLNGFPIHKEDFRTKDFFPAISQMKAAHEYFDCVFLDPPIFSETKKGIVDLAQSYTRLMNKVRPLIAHNGYLVAINNALFLSGSAYLQQIEALCQDGYLSIVEQIPVPDDFVGKPITQAGNLVADPAPFNHSTKIVVLKVTRKEQ